MCSSPARWRFCSNPKHTRAHYDQLLCWSELFGACCPVSHPGFNLQNDAVHKTVLLHARCVFPCKLNQSGEKSASSSTVNALAMNDAKKEDMDLIPENCLSILLYPKLYIMYIH